MLIYENVAIKSKFIGGLLDMSTTQTLVLPAYRKHFFLAALILVVLAYLFWTGSRYPALDEKAMMSGAIQLEDSLSFEAKYPLTEDMGLLDRIFWSTLNWVNTNKKGMTFGVLFATAITLILIPAIYLILHDITGHAHKRGETVDEAELEAASSPVESA